MKYILFYIFLLLIGADTSFAQTNPNLQAGEGFVEVHGGKLWYSIIGEGDEPPLLMMHGGPGGTSRSFYLFEKLTKNRPLIIFDQLGGGHSTRHQDTTLLKVHEFVDQVADLKTHLKLNEFYLYGHSWGTALALEYYTAHPEGVKGIIFNSPYFSTAIWEADADTLIDLLPDTIQTAIAQGEASGNFEAESYQQANTFYLKNYGLRKKPLAIPIETKPARGNYFIYNYMWGPDRVYCQWYIKNL